MARMIIVNHLVADELTYELTVRGFKAGNLDEIQMTYRSEKSRDNIKHLTYFVYL